MFLNLLVFFLVILALRFLINLSKYLQCKRYFEDYKRYIEGGGWKIVEHSLQIVKLFEDAGVEDATVTHVEEIGYGNLQSSRPSVFRNISIKRQDIASHVVTMFHQAIGVYRSRMIETINPLFWIETIIFLPRQFMKYLGVSSESLATKILQAIYWTFGVLFGLYKVEFETLLKDWISKQLP